MVEGKAIIITGGLLNDIHAKTAHGLLRSGDRFEIVGIIDEVNHGKSIRDILDNDMKEVPVFKDIQEFSESSIKADYAIIGVATKGGVIPDTMKSILLESISQGLSIVNGLHAHLVDIPEIKSLAEKESVDLIDIRKPKPFHESHFWSGDIKKVTCHKLAVLGTDCALGKRTTSRMLTADLNDAGYNAQMIYTGQTGWLQGTKYGFIFDATLNDFISGEIEFSMLECFNNENPDFIILEGQSALRNPSGPCGSEFIVSGNLDGVILQHDPVRKKYKDLDYDAEIPNLENEIRLIEMYGSKTVGVCLNTKSMQETDAIDLADELETRLGIPVCLPLINGLGKIVDQLTK